jgi:hypothetical protein
MIALFMFMIEICGISFLIYLLRDDIVDFFNQNLHMDISNILYSEILKDFAWVGFEIGIFMIGILFFIAMKDSKEKEKIEKAESNGFWKGLFLGWLFFG